MLREFLLDGLEVRDRIAILCRRNVDQVEQQARPFDMSQELDAEAVAQMRAFDQSGNVGDDERSCPDRSDNAQMGFERRERIVRNLGTRGRDTGDQRGFSGVGKADQADVGQQLQFEAERLLLARPSVLRSAWRAIHRGREVRVAVTATSARRRSGRALGPVKS